MNSPHMTSARAVPDAGSHSIGDVRRSLESLLERFQGAEIFAIFYDEAARHSAAFRLSENQICRSTIFSLSPAIASEGLRPFGHALAQFMMVWQRYRRNGSSRLSSRSPVASSRESVTQRVACNSAAGPRKRSLFHQ